MHACFQFQFSSPVAAGSSPGLNFAPSVPSSTPQPMMTGNFNFVSNPTSSADSSVSGVKPATALKRGSVMDVLGAKAESTQQLAIGRVKAAPVLKQGSVMDILGKKDPVVHTSEQSAPKLPTTEAISQPPLTSLFQKPAGSWECPTCMINNKPELAKCAACETPKPAPKGTTVLTVPVPGVQLSTSQVCVLSSI